MQRSLFNRKQAPLARQEPRYSIMKPAGVASTPGILSASPDSPAIFQRLPAHQGDGRQGRRLHCIIAGLLEPGFLAKALGIDAQQ